MHVPADVDDPSIRAFPVMGLAHNLALMKLHACMLFAVNPCRHVLFVGLLWLCCDFIYTWDTCITNKHTPFRAGTPLSQSLRSLRKGCLVIADSILSIRFGNFFLSFIKFFTLSALLVGRGPVQPQNGGYGNAILRFPLDLSDVEDYFIPANGVYLDNVRSFGHLFKETLTLIIIIIITIIITRLFQP